MEKDRIGWDSDIPTLTDQSFYIWGPCVLVIGLLQ